MPWDQNDYIAARQAIQGSEEDEETKKALRREIRRYETLNPSAAPTGIEAFEASTGSRQPTDAELAAEEPKLPDIIPETQAYKRPGATKGGFWSSREWYEPTLEQFKAELEPVVGVKDVAGINENDALFKRYADMKWAQAHDAAAQKGVKLTRVKDIDTSDFAGKAAKFGAEVEKHLGSALLGIEEGALGGLPTAGAAKLEELSGFNPDASQEIAEARGLSPGARIAGDVVGVLSPSGIASQVGKGATKLVGPAAGALVVKGGGRLPARLLGRGATAAAGGGAGLTALGGAQEVAQGVNPFSLDFLGRRGKDLALGAAGGVGSEALGTAAQRLGRIGEVERAKAVAREGAGAEKLNPILADLGATAGYNLAPEKDKELVATLAGMALGGSGWGRYALITRLARGAPVTGEGALKAMAKQLQAAPLPPDVVGAIREKMITKGSEVFKPGRGAGAVFGIPFTSAGRSPATLSPDEAEAFVRDLIETAPKESETAPAESEASGEAIQPISYGGLIPESVEEGLSMVDSALGRGQSAPQAWQEDRSFVTMLHSLGPAFKKAGKSEEEIQDRKSVV